MLSRRTLVQLGMGGVVATLSNAAEAQTRSQLSFLLPSVSSDRIGLKFWTTGSQPAPPRLTVDGMEGEVSATDSTGRVWRALSTRLLPGTRHELRLRDSHGRDLRSPWTLKTLPAAQTPVESMRVLIFTCAGGDEAQIGRPGQSVFLSVAARRALLDRALTFQPDLVIANGDHVYWDQDSLLKHGNPLVAGAVNAFYASVAQLDGNAPADSVGNRTALTAILSRQIASVYEDRLAATPTIFVADDHDYFENDIAGPWGSTFPPRAFASGLQSLTKELAYPYAFNVSNAVQTVRFGSLAEFVLYDCRKSLSREKGGGFLTDRDERLIVRRTRRSTAHQMLHIPSTPFGWTAGKWAEWYEDRGAVGGTYGDDKAFWNPSWFDQHQRLLRALTTQRGRAAIAVSGDLHASAAAQIHRSGDLDLSANPLTTILTGPLGTGDIGFPSAARGEAPKAAGALDLRSLASLEERNGFTLLDIEPESVTARLFAWRPPEAIDAISTLEPRATISIARSS